MSKAKGSPTLTIKQERFVVEYGDCLDVREASSRSGYRLRKCHDQLRPFYVYLLTDKKGEVFYVGKGKGKRYRFHVNEWKKGELNNPAKMLRIEKAMKDGGVSHYCFADGLPERRAFDLERYLILSIGVERLTNRGSGLPTDQERAAFMVSRFKPFDVWLAERPRAEEEVSFVRAIRAETEKVAREGYIREVTITRFADGSQSVEFG